MTRLGRALLVLMLALPLAGQISRNRQWRMIAPPGPVASRPASCTANVHFYVCSGAGCANNLVIQYCTATDTWTDAAGAGGGGITTLNTLTAATQTFATGTAGTDFAISSATSTHTFDLPSSSASARGLLTSTDWSTFNGKVGGGAALTAVSNMPRVSSSGVLGLSKMTCTDSPVTCQAYDDTATTGATTFTLRAGAGQATTSLFTWLAAGGTTDVAATGTALNVRSDFLHAWSSTTDATGAKDLGLYRNAAGTLEVNNGVAGTYRDIVLRTLQANTSVNLGATTGTLNWWGGAAYDTGLARNAAGVLEVHNGTAGQFRDLKLRTLFADPQAEPSCAAGQYWIHADSGTSKWRKCANGSLTDLDTTGGGSGLANYETTFSAQTSITVTGATHAFAHRKIVVECYDDSSPRQRIDPSLVTVDSTSFDVVVTFSASTTGLCVLNGSGGAGTVTSVGLTMPAEFSVSGSPVTSSGTLAVTKATQTENFIYAGPTANPAAAPTFRAMVKADTPSTTVHTDQGNTFSTGAQSFASATSVTIPTSAGAAPTANGSVAYDSTANQYKAGVNTAANYLVQAAAALTSGQLLQGSGDGKAAASGVTVQAAGGTGTAVTDAGDATSLARSDHEHRVPWQAGFHLEATPATGESTVPLPVNEACGGSIDATAVGIVAITKGTGTMTFNVIRYNNAGVSQGNIFSATQTYSNAGNNRQSFAPDQNATGIGATDYFRVNLVTVNGQDDLTLAVQGKCKNVN